MATKQELLFGAIVDLLRADSGENSLTDLINATDKEIKIGRKLPIVKDRTPYIAISIPVTVPYIANSTTILKRSTVLFNCIARNELTVIQIADRLESLLDSESVETNRGYLNFSNSSVRNLQTTFLSRSAQIFEEDVDIWSIDIEAEVIWVDVPC